MRKVPSPEPSGTTHASLEVDYGCRLKEDDTRHWMLAGWQWTEDDSCSDVTESSLRDGRLLTGSVTRMSIEGKRYIVDCDFGYGPTDGSVLDRNVRRDAMRVRTGGETGKASPVVQARTKPIE